MEVKAAPTGKIELISGEGRLALVSPLFDGWKETMIWTALQGLMGQVWAWMTPEEAPRVACCISGDFVSLAGEGDSVEAHALLRHVKTVLDGREAIVASRAGRWDDAVADVFPDAQRGERYATDKSADGFNRKKLQGFVRSCPPTLTLSPIDGALYDKVMAESWSKDFCACFASKEDYLAHGLGVVALKNGMPVGGASSYTYYRGGIEIQTDTREDMRRQGIAAACCARLILTCLEKGMYPSWDAATPASAALAAKLGYRITGAYPIWEVGGGQP